MCPNSQLSGDGKRTEVSRARRRRSNRSGCRPVDTGITDRIELKLARTIEGDGGAIHRHFERIRRRRELLTGIGDDISRREARVGLNRRFYLNPSAARRVRKHTIKVGCAHLNHLRENTAVQRHRVSIRRRRGDIITRTGTRRGAIRLFTSGELGPAGLGAPEGDLTLYVPFNGFEFTSVRRPI